MITIISNRKQIHYTDLVTHLKKCIHPSVSRIILREKDLPLEVVKRKIKAIKSTPGLKEIPLFLNGPYDISQTFGADGRHFTMDQYRAYTLLAHQPSFMLGVSVHGLHEIQEVNPLGVTYMLYGHIFPTACKAGLQERGLDNLKMLLEQSNSPLVALGGIEPSNYKRLFEKGCKEFAMMSSLMQVEDPQKYLNLFESQ